MTKGSQRRCHQLVPFRQARQPLLDAMVLTFESLLLDARRVQASRRSVRRSDRISHQHHCQRRGTCVRTRR
jgi:hypothetical protein